MLFIDSAELSFDGRQILSGCYLQCDKGEVVGLLGRNGSGKSSLLKIIFGTLKASFKHLRIDDVIVKNGFDNNRVVYLPQDNFLPPFITMKKLLGSLSSEILACLDDVEFIKESMDKNIGQLSGGMQRFVEAIWLLGQKADYILLDEPFSGLAPIHIELLQKIIRELGQKKGIILTDHLYRPLLEISSRVVLLHNNSVYPIKTEDDLIRYNYIPDYQ
jgi:lipopolysaccharide export system ATP-binding protein